MNDDRKHLLNILYRLGELWPQEWKTDLSEAADHAKTYLEGQGVKVDCATLPKPQTDVEFDESVSIIRRALQSALYPKPEGDKLRSDALYRLMVLKSPQTTPPTNPTTASI